MKYNYYDSNKIVIHGKAVPGQTLAWGETKMLTADKIQSVNTTDYWGNVLYENGRPTTVLSNGRYILLNQDSTLTWCSVEKDHLGSNRVVREETSGINRLQINHYYPFGNTFGEYNHCDENTDLQRYKFNGKELDLVHGLRLYDYGARMYDQILGCWTSVDPMAEKYYHLKNKCMKRLFVKTTFFVLLGICFLSCNKRDGKTITLMPSLYIKSYDVTYKSDSIIIKENSKEKNGKTNAKWNLYRHDDEFYLTGEYGKFLFLSNKHNMDSIIEKYDYLPIHIIIKKINDSLYVSSLSRMVVDEALVLEVLYNKDYSIRQIRHETVWTDYVPKKQHALECVPILFKSKQTKNNDVIKY